MHCNFLKLLDRTLLYLLFDNTRLTDSSFNNTVTNAQIQLAK